MFGLRPKTYFDKCELDIRFGFEDSTRIRI